MMPVGWKPRSAGRTLNSARSKAPLTQRRAISAPSLSIIKGSRRPLILKNAAATSALPSQGIVRTVAGDVEEAEKSMRDRRKLTALCVRDIRSLIEDGKGIAAASKFTENKRLLQGGMDEKSFESFSREVAKAKNDFFASSRGPSRPYPYRFAHCRQPH